MPLAEKHYIILEKFGTEREIFFVHLSLLLSQSFGEDRSLTNCIGTTSHQFVAVSECLCAYGKIVCLAEYRASWFFTNSGFQTTSSSKICHVHFPNLMSLSVLKCVLPMRKGNIYSYSMNGKNTDPILFYDTISHFSIKQKNQRFRNFRNNTFCGKFHKGSYIYAAQCFERMITGFEIFSWNQAVRLII